MAIDLSKYSALAALALTVLWSGKVLAANPTAEDALTLQPVQKDVAIDRPNAADISKCTIKPEKSGGKTGWVIRDGSGQILRNFMDTNNDNVVDQWSYYKDGIEVYRDIDTNFNRKADQYRWLNTAGTRWGVDADENGKIDFWKNISAEEVTAELVAALRDRDRLRFERLLLTAKELKTLGVGPAKSDQLVKMIEAATANFVKLASQQKLVTPETKWVSFGGGLPGMVPAGTEDSAADLVVYENIAAMIETDGKPQAISIGTLVHVKDGWRLIDVPQVLEDAAAAVEPKPFFFAVTRSERADQPVGKPSEKTQELLAELNKLGDQQHERRAEVLEQLASEAENPEMRAQWYRQLADSLSSAVQSGSFDAGNERLKVLREKLKNEIKDEELATYVEYRCLSAEHGQALAKPNPDFAKIQEKWIGDLEQFIEQSKKSPDSADAMMELAIAQEFGGDEEKALKWYETIAKEFPQSPVQPKAKGASLRLSSVGKSIQLVGQQADGRKLDLAKLKGKVTLVQYWATWCEPYKAELPLLKDLHQKYAKRGFEIVGVCLDNDKKLMLEFLQENDPHWPQLFEAGGLNNRFANELGIQTLPTMILIDKDGKVVNRNIRAQELESELKKLLK